MFKKLRFSEDKYDDLFIVCTALKKYHIKSSRSRRMTVIQPSRFLNGCTKWGLQPTNESKRASLDILSRIANNLLVITCWRTIQEMLNFICRLQEISKILLLMPLSTSQQKHARLLPHLSLFFTDRAKWLWKKMSSSVKRQWDWVFINCYISSRKVVTESFFFSSLCFMEKMCNR